MMIVVMLSVLLLPSVLTASWAAASLWEGARPEVSFDDAADEAASTEEPCPPTLTYQTPGTRRPRWPVWVHAPLWLLAVWPYAVVALVLFVTVTARLHLGHWPDGRPPWNYPYLGGAGHRAMHYGLIGLIWLAPTQLLTLVIAIVHHSTRSLRRERVFAWLLIASAAGWATCVTFVGLTGFMNLAFD